MVIREDGFVDIESILQKVNISIEKLHSIVDNDCKRRFKIITEGERKFIRANQGHSLPFIDDEKLLKRIIVDSDLNIIERLIIHGTYLNKWESIKVNGLNRMSRSHIHFISVNDLKLECSSLQVKKFNEFTNLNDLVSKLSNCKCVAGIRPTSEVLIFIDMARPFYKEKYNFYVSDNGIILTKGDSKGKIDPELFIFCIDIKNGKVLLDNVRNDNVGTELFKLICDSIC
ncbi:Phosphotransferase KptA/Tpt1 [Cryptosporidium felis]|nr:Phosphotransferase KptA/Tpt1 [Cryptosporidium felis]